MLILILYIILAILLSGFAYQLNIMRPIEAILTSITLILYGILGYNGLNGYLTQAIELIGALYFLYKAITTGKRIAERLNQIDDVTGEEKD